MEEYEYDDKIRIQNLRTIDAEIAAIFDDLKKSRIERELIETQRRKFFEEQKQNLAEETKNTH